MASFINDSLQHPQSIGSLPDMNGQFRYLKESLPTRGQHAVGLDADYASNRINQGYRTQMICPNIIDKFSLIVYEKREIPESIKEVVVGAAGGVTQVLIGQPFDIVKVRMQNGNGSAAHIAGNIWKREGPLAFYKGSLAPFVGVGACISIVYSSFHGFSHGLQSFNSRNHNDPTLSLPQIYLAGGMAGLVNSIISGPMEHIRIRLQIQSSQSSQQLYLGVSDCIRKISRQAGPTGLYRGQSATMLREFGSYGVWFSVYEVLLRKVMEKEHKPRDEIASWKIAACGALTGEILWTLNYPIDVIKTKMNADGFGVEQKYRNMRDVIRQTWRVDGLHGFFRGLSPTLLRALPVSAGTFTVVEAVRKAL